MSKQIVPTGNKLTPLGMKIHQNNADKKLIPARQQSKNKTCGNCGKVYLEYLGKCPKCGGK